MVEADAYLFDIDGTLLVTRDLVHWNALHQAMLEVYAVDTNIDGIPYHGKTDVAILRAALARRGISDHTFYDRLPRALAIVCREVSANSGGIVPEVCPSIPQFLAQLRDRNRLLGVASGNLETVGWHKVHCAGLREFFSQGSFGDRCEMRAEIFDNAKRLAQTILGASAKVCFVGDTPDDICAARQVNANIIAVGTGTFSFDELSALHPDECCRCCTELLDRLPT